MRRSKKQTAQDKKWIKAIFILPVNVVVVIPALILFFSEQKVEVKFNLLSALGVLSFGVGLALVAFTIMLFKNQGKGSLAPWNPPSKLVWQGPYQYVRNPMISGVGWMLLGEVMVFLNDGLACWWLFFCVINALYIPYMEEPDLSRRFGKDYEEYKANVPRWIPRLSPWKKISRWKTSAYFDYLVQPI